jgi:hypothetical protein
MGNTGFLNPSFELLQILPATASSIFWRNVARLPQHRRVGGSFFKQLPVVIHGSRLSVPAMSSTRIRIVRAGWHQNMAGSRFDARLQPDRARRKP